MKWSRMSAAKARDSWDQLVAREMQPGMMNSEYAKFREDLLAAMPSPVPGSKLGSEFDVESGIVLYRILQSAGFTLRDAADDRIWRFMSLRICPDIVARRWGNAPDRFWSNRSRVWLRAIWWLVHLAWQGTEEETRKALAQVTADMIVQVIERPGRGGFRIELMRVVFAEQSRRRLNEGQFRAAMKLNTARVLLTEPAFGEGGLAGYVGTLFSAAAPGGEREAA